MFLSAVILLPALVGFSSMSESDPWRCESDSLAKTFADSSRIEIEESEEGVLYIWATVPSEMPEVILMGVFLSRVESDGTSMRALLMSGPNNNGSTNAGFTVNKADISKYKLTAQYWEGTPGVTLDGCNYYYDLDFET